MVYRYLKCKTTASLFKNNDFRVELDDSNEKLGYRMRNAQVEKVPYTIVIGDNEVKNRTVTYRKYSSKDQITITLDDFIKLLADEIKNKK